MKSLWNLFCQQKNLSTGIVALIQRADGIGLAHLQFNAAEKQPLLVHCLFVPVVDSPSWNREIMKLIRHCGVEKARFVGILDRDAYTLFPADAPAVPREEWGLNMRWKIGDRINYPVEQAVVEIFDLPGRTMEDDSGRIYVAVAQDTEVQRQADIFLNAGLDLLGIDIPELALGRLTYGLDEDSKGLGLLHLDPDGGLVMVRRNKSLFLARTIETELQQLLFSISDTTMPTAFELDVKLDELSMELRRTFDFYESNFIQSPLEDLFVTPMLMPFAAFWSQDAQSGGNDFLAALANKLGMRVQYLPLERIVQRSPGIEDADLIHCLPAIGAALGFAPGL